MPEPKPLRVLFVGNSYTYCNELPKMVEALAAAAAAVPSVCTDGVLVGGWSLARHWRDGVAQQKIARRRYDFVVLQDHSVEPMINPWATHKFARLFDRVIRDGGAETVLYLTWAREHLPELQRYLTRTYVAIARELGARVAPVGEAWKRALRKRTGLVLHTPDHSHPNRKGSYLAACAFFAALLGRSPEGLPARLAVPERGGRRVLASLTRADAAFFQRTAWQTAQAFRARHPR